MPGKQKTSWPNPRAHPRYLMDQRLIVKTTSPLHGRTKDISEGGMGATVAGEILTNRPVELHFHLPGSPTPLKIMAEVRHRQGFQYGFRFLAASEQQKSQIRQAVRALQPAP
jgi:c-di-GMP-binding flagellar brake protein YcgR